MGGQTVRRLKKTDGKPKQNIGAGGKHQKP
jgi:hypothetical protein